MKTALLVTLEYPPQVGGVSRYLENLAVAAPLGTLQVLAPERADAREYDARHRVRVLRRTLQWKIPKFDWLAALLAVHRFCRQERPSTLIISHLLPIGYVARCIQVCFGIPYVVVLHGMDAALAAEGSAFTRWAARAILAHASKVVANSAYTASLAAAMGVTKKRIMVAYPSSGISQDITVTPQERADFLQRWGFSSDDFVMITIARLVIRKGIDLVIEAVARLRDLGRTVRYVIVGDGPEKDHLVRLVASLHLEDQVVFSGGLAAEMMPIAYASGDLFVMTPRQIGGDVEGFGIVYLEAGLMGKPVIASRSGGVAEAVEDGASGTVIESKDVNALVDAIVMLQDSPETRERYGRRGRERALAEFSAEKQFGPLLDYLQTL